MSMGLQERESATLENGKQEPTSQTGNSNGGSPFIHSESSHEYLPDSAETNCSNCVGISPDEC